MNDGEPTVSSTLLSGRKEKEPQPTHLSHLSLYIKLYMHTHIHIYIYTYIYIDMSCSESILMDSRNTFKIQFFCVMIRASHLARTSPIPTPAQRFELDLDLKLT